MPGPLHIRNKPLVTKDCGFCPMGEEYTVKYITTDMGLLKMPTLIISKTK